MNGLKGQCRLGDNAFQGKLFPMFEKKGAFKEVPFVLAFAECSSFESHPAVREGRQEQDLAIGTSGHDFGCTQAQAVAAGLRSSTVSRIVG